MKVPLSLVIAASATLACAADPRGDNPDAGPSTPGEQLAKFHVPPGFEVQLVAAEPEIQKPLALNFDSAGRLWASGTELYPWPAATDANGRSIAGFDKAWQEMADAFHVGDGAPTPLRFGKDTVRILSDFGPDGRARKIATFADHLNIPTGIQPLPGRTGAPGESAIVFSIPHIWRMTDADGDGRAEVREPLYEGFGFTDTHGMASNFLYWIDGWIYGCHGFRNRSEVRDRTGRVTVFESGNTYRFRPDGSHIEYYTHGQTNPYGLTVDPLGNFFSADSHSKPVMLLVRGGYYAGIGKEHDGLGFAPTITDDDHGSSSIAGIACYADDKFPEEFRGNLFNGNPVTRRINRARLEWHGSSPRAIRLEDFLTCDDPWFRPVQVKLGPDGALWIADFYNPIIGHYEMPLTDARRDQRHGRIWRVVWRGEKATEPAADARPEVPGTTRVPRVGEGVPPSRTSDDAPIPGTSSTLSAPQKVRDGGTPSPTRGTRVVPGPTTAPDLTALDAAALVEKLADPNLIVRALATNELADRIGAAAGPALESLIAAMPEPSLDDLTRGTWTMTPTASTTLLQYARAHARWAGDRTGLPPAKHLDSDSPRPPRSLYFEMLPPLESEAEAIHALRATLENLPPPQLLIEQVEQDRDLFMIAPDGSAFADFAGSNARVAKGTAWERRGAAELLGLGENPSARCINHLVFALRTVPPDDPMLKYTIRRSLATQLSWPGRFWHARWLAADQPEIADLLEDAALGVPTPESAKFLLLRLIATRSSSPRASDHLKHTARYLAEEELTRFVALTEQASDASLPRRFALADALAVAARERKVALPDDARAWMERTLVETLSAGKDKLLDDAIEAVRERETEAKRAPLASIVVRAGEDGRRRAAALEAMGNLPGATGIAEFALHDPSSLTLQKKAAGMLGAETASEARATLLAALATAPTELALSIAVALARTDTGCRELLDLIEAGKAPATLLRSRFVSFTIEGRARALRDRASALTKDLPPEDKRLDAVIAQRAGDFRGARPSREHGAQIFQQHCAACHRIRDAGGNVGPNLDGVSARGAQRLIEDILDPNRNVDPTFHQTVVETHDGALFAGANLRDDGTTLTLTDAAGKDTSIAIADIKSRTASKLSLMPAIFETQIAPADFHDLVAYLLGAGSRD